MSNSHKGQILTLEGNGVGEAIANSKLSYDAMGSLEYSGTCKYGIEDADTRHFISKLLYDAMGGLIKEVFATNQRYTGATDITVDLSTPQALITCTGSDFNEVAPGDKLFINTALNPNVWVTIQQKISIDSVLIGITDSATLTAEIATPVAATDIVLSLENNETKPFDKKRWDLRSLYIYR